MTKKKILTGLNTSPESLSALRAAVSIASRIEAELLGIYVEDINLLNLASHPCAASFSQLGVTCEVTQDDGVVELLIRMQIDSARKALDSMANAVGVPAELEITRGRVQEEILVAAKAADMVFLGWSDRLSPGFKLGSTAKFVAENAPVPVLLLQVGDKFPHEEVWILAQEQKEADFVKEKLQELGFKEENLRYQIGDFSGISKLGPKDLVAIADTMVNYVHYFNCSVIVVR